MQRARSGPLAGLLISAALLQSGGLRAEPVAVRHIEGTTRGFLVLRTAEGKTIASGDLVQIVQGDHIVSNLVFHFKDGSVDDETAVYSQRRNFRLLSDHHLQKGPSFHDPMDVSIDATTGQVTVRSTHDGKEKVETHHLDLPEDLANGLVTTIVKNLPDGATETKVSYLAATPKPRIVKLLIKPEGDETFRTAGAPHKAIRYDIKVELGGVAGVVAPIVGKQPKDTHMWILGGKAPVFVRLEGELFQDGPIWTIEQTTPAWPKSLHSR